MPHLVWIVTMTAFVGLLALAMTDKRRQTLLLGCAVACGSLALPVGLAARRAATEIPASSKVDAVLDGTSASQCNDAMNVRVCSLPRWEGWRDDWRNTAVGVLRLVPGNATAKLQIIQSGIFSPSGLNASYSAAPLPQDRVYVGLTISHRDSNVELAGSVAAWLVDRPTTPQVPYTSAAIGPPPCFDSSDATTAGLWLLSRAEPAARRELRAAAADGRNYQLGSVQGSPRAVRLATDMLRLDPQVVSGVIAAQLPALRTGRNGLAEALHLARRKPLIPHEGTPPDYPVCP